MTRRETSYPPRLKADERPPSRLCEAEGCPAHGEFRAPRSRDPQAPPHWFCLEHVREYNKNWNWFAGMSQGEIEQEQARTTTWSRPTWRLGARVAGGGIRDPHGLLFDLDLAVDEQAAPQGQPPRVKPIKPEDRKALIALELDPGATSQDIKSRYKDLVKRYHPDRNGGDRTAEARLREVIAAYRHLTEAGYPQNN